MSQNRVKYSQNFIKDPLLIEDLLSKTTINSDDLVIEIGGGRGVITNELSRIVNKVISYEIDENFIEILKERFQDIDNVDIRGENFLKAILPSQSYKIFANIPFKYSADILRKLVTLNSKAEDIYLFVQGEFYDRLAGYPNETLFSLITKPLYNVELMYEFSKLDFVPSPSVDVVLIHLSSRGKDRLSNVKYLTFRDFVSYLLNSHKKDLMNALNLLFTTKQISRLSKDLKLNTKNVVSRLNYDQWIALFEFFIVGVDRQKQKVINKAYLKQKSSQKNMTKVNRSWGRWEKKK